MIALLSSVARAENTAVNSGDWFSPAVWSSNAVPFNGDGEADVRINNAAAVSIGTGNASASGRITVGQQGIGFLSMSGTETTLDIADSLWIGDVPGSVGSYSQFDGVNKVAVTVRLGSNGSGFARIAGGTLETGSHLRIGRNASGVGSLHLTGGVISTHTTLDGSDMVGNFGTGFLTIDGGTMLAKAESIGTAVSDDEGVNIDVGFDNNSYGHLTLNSGVIRSARGIRAGSAPAIGIIEINGGTMTADGNVNIGRLAPGVGIFRMTGGFVRTNFDHSGSSFRDFLVGERGTGVATISGGSVDARGGLHVSSFAGSRGTLCIEGGHVDVGRGDDGAGSGGAFKFNVGINAGCFGFARLSGGTVIHHDVSGNEPDIVIGTRGTGVLEVTGSALLQTHVDVLIGSEGTSMGSATVNAGTIDARDLEIGRDGTGFVAIDGTAEVMLSRHVHIASGTGNGSLTIAGGHTTVAGGTLHIGSSSSSAAVFHHIGGLLALTAIDNTKGGIHNFSGGTLTRATGGAITYDGNFAMASGATLKLDTDKSLAISGGYDSAGGEIKIDGTAIDNANPDGVTVETGEYFVLSVGDPFGTGGAGRNLTDDVSLDGILVSGIFSPSGGTRISEADFEAGNFDPSTDHVFALVEGQSADGDGQVGIKWSIAPVLPVFLAS